jgi:hypothetical protein
VKRVRPVVVLEAGSWEAAQVAAGLIALRSDFHRRAENGGDQRWTAQQERLLADLRELALLPSPGNRVEGPVTCADGASEADGLAGGVEWWRVGHVASALGVTGRRVRQMCAEGALPARKLDGEWIIRRSDVPVERTEKQRA